MVNPPKRGLARRTPGYGAIRRRRIATVLVLLSIAGLGVAAYSLLTVNGPFSKSSASKPASMKAVLDAWEKGDRSLCLELSAASSALVPLDPFYLTFHGFSAFYLAMEKAQGEERLGLLDESVMALRKAFASGKRLPARGEASYVLGKAYYFKGEPWWDLAVEQLEKATREGFDGPDVNEYLAVLYAGMGDNARAVERFEAAMGKGKTQLLLLAAAGSYRALGDGTKARALLEEALALDQDAVVSQKCRLMLGDMAMDARDFQGAESMYQAAVNADPGSAEAWYRLGLAFQSRNDPVKARSAWRKAVSLDPMHAASRQKLGERL